MRKISVGYTVDLVWILMTDTLWIRSDRLAALKEFAASASHRWPDVPMPRRGSPAMRATSTRKVCA